MITRQEALNLIEEKNPIKRVYQKTLVFPWEARHCGKTMFGFKVFKKEPDGSKGGDTLKTQYVCRVCGDLYYYNPLADPIQFGS